MLLYARDWQSLAYILIVPALTALQWVFGFHIVAYAIVLFLMVGIGVIHHNHTHLPMWRWTWLNRSTDLILTALQGHPTYVFYATHIDNHHRYHHGELDAARTYRWGDTNHLLGYLLHPLQAVWALYPLFVAWLKDGIRADTKPWRFALLQYAIVAVLWGGLAWIDWQKFALFVLVPQLFGLHWLLAANYLQHAHADGRSTINFSRNFEGWVNIAWFNIGLHTAHHQQPTLHWSRLPEAHAAVKHRVDPRLNERGLAAYMWRTFVLSIFSAKYRSVSLMDSSPRAVAKIDTA
ncbi:MAG: fatty acid desaturase family protein [Casimicrobium sp.]